MNTIRKTLFCLAFSLFVCLSATSRSLEPNKLMIDTVVNVIDTVPAMESFLEIKPTIISGIEDLRNEQSILQTMLQTNQKKAKTDIEKSIVSDAFNYVRNNTRYYEHDLFGDRRQKDSQDIRKGKLTETVRSFLSHYDENYLSTEIANLSNSLDNDWTSFLTNPPMKQISIQIENPNYRGFHFDDYYDLNKIEQARLLGEYDFVISDRGHKKKETYPIEVSYLQFSEMPNCRVIDNYCMEIYDNNGKLVYVPILKRQSDTDLLPNFISKEIRRLVYLKDYQNNKYNILSSSPKTQNFLSLWLLRNHGLSKSDQELSELNLEGYFRGMGGLMGTNATREMKNDVDK